jgi:23S rRNA pseudouridine2605 synthase
LRGRLDPRQTRVIVYNKPEGEICSRDDPGDRPTVFRHLPKLKGSRWVVVGRLDLNTRGLLLFTNNGDLANQLMHPEFGLEREYLCRVFGNVDETSIQRLIEGVVLDGETAKFLSVKRQRGEGRNTWYKVVVTEGRYREVRRMWETVGCRVSRLVRVRYGSVILPRNLRPGETMELKASELSKLLPQETKDQSTKQEKTDDSRTRWQKPGFKKAKSPRKGSSRKHSSKRGSPAQPSRNRSGRGVAKKTGRRTKR